MKKQIKRRRRRKINDVFAGILKDRDSEYIEIIAKNINDANAIMEHIHRGNIKMVYKANRYTETTLKKIETLHYDDFSEILNRSLNLLF